MEMPIDEKRRQALRNLNYSKNRNHLNSLKEKDASIKRVSTFVKKLKLLTPENFKVLLDELDQLRLSKFIEEVAFSLLENRPKSTLEWENFLEICSVLNISYPEFAPCLQNSHARIFDNFLSDAALLSSPSIGKVRTLYRMYFELYLIGIFDDANPLKKYLNSIIDTDESTFELAGNVLIYVLKHFSDVLFQDESSFLTSDVSLQLKNSMLEFHKAASRVLIRRFGKLNKMEFKGKQFYEKKGDLSDKQVQEYIEHKDRFNDLHNLIIELSAMLNIDPPEIKLSEDAPVLIEGKIVFADMDLLKTKNSLNVFESEEERTFYETLIDLKDCVPSNLLPHSLSDGSCVEEFHDDCENALDVPEIDPDATRIQESTIDDLSIFLERLSRTASISEADKLAIEFCYLQNKKSVKSVPDRILDLLRNRLDLIPFVARFLATIKPHFSQFTNSIVETVLGQFRFLSYKKDPIKVTRSRVCRILSELTKFRVLSQGQCFSCLKRVIVDDFTLYNIDMACILLENCGRFMANQPESKARIENLTEILLKKKVSGTLDQHKIMLIENALYLMKIHVLNEQTPLNTKIYSLLELYIEYLFHSMLINTDVKEVFKRLRELPWSNEETSRMVKNCFVSSWKSKDNSIENFAIIASGLQKFRPEFSMDLIDDILETVFFGLERSLKE